MSIVNKGLPIWYALTRQQEAYIKVDVLALPDIDGASQNLALDLDGQVLAALCWLNNPIEHYVSAKATFYPVRRRARHTFSNEVREERGHTDGDLDRLALDDILAVLALQQIQGLAILNLDCLNSILDVLLLDTE